MSEAENPRLVGGAVRYVKWIPVAVFALAAVAVSSLWGRHVVAEGMAHSSYANAKSTLASDIQSARTQGMFPSELHPYSAQLRAIDGAKAPSDGGFWSSRAEGYYSGQSAKLQALDRRLESSVRRATHQAMTQLSGILTAYGEQLKLGHRYGLALKAQVKLWGQQRSNFARAHSVGDFRGQAGLAQPQLQSLEHVVGARKSEVDGIVASAGHSPQALVKIQALARRKEAWSRAQLAKISLFDPHQSLGTWLDKVSAWALSRKSTHFAAVGVADLQRVAEKVHESLLSTLPSKWIEVSTEGQWIRMYQGPTIVNSGVVTTGGPQLPTEHGSFHIYEKISPFTFHSPWPPGSQYWYPDSPVSYWMPFNGGAGLHDAPWRSVFGPGSNLTPTPGTQIDGTHGCVNLPYATAQWVWDWAPIGTTVIVI